MKNLFIIKLSLTLNVILFISCQNVETNRDISTENNINMKDSNNIYIDKYAGGYKVEVKNIYSNTTAEVYILRNDGSAKWMYIINDRNGGADVKSEKIGNWNATENSITINVNGNTGVITEEFKLINGEFYDSLTGERTLKLQ